MKNDMQNIDEKYEEEMEYYLRKIDSKPLKQKLEETSTAKLAKKEVVEAMKILYPDHESELQALHHEIKEIREGDQEVYDHTKYFRDSENVKGFIPKLLADDIEEDYTFKKIKDSEELYVCKDGYYQPKGEQVIEEEAEKRLQVAFRKQRATQVISQIEARNYIKRKEFRPPKRMINLENGVYDLEEEELVNHSSEYLFTHQIPTRYDPGKGCESIHSFLEDIVRTEEEVKTLREIAGYLLLPDLPIPKAFMLLGKGNNGKSRYLDLLRELVGEENITEKGLQHLGGQFGTHGLQRKLGVIDDDLSSRKINEESAGTMKKLTGGSRIGAEIKHGAYYNFHNHANPVFAANELPRTVDDTDGFYRRWILVEFPYKFMKNPNPEEDLEKKGRPKKELMEEIAAQDEIEGFLWWAIQDLKDVLDNNEFTHAPTTQEAREKWREYSVPLVKFIQTHVKQGVTRNQAQRETGEDAGIQEYQFDYVRKDFLQEIIGDYCEARSHSRPSKKAITRELKKELYVGTKSRTRREPEDKQVPVYSGIKVSYPDVGGCAGVQTYSETFKQACGHERVESSKQSVHVNTGGRPDYHGCKEDVIDLINCEEGKVEVTEIVEKLDYKESRVEDVIDELIDNGELYQPISGKVDIL